MTQTKYRNLITRILEMDKAYYEDDNPIATDAEYDQLKKQLEETEKDHPDWIEQNSPSKRPGGKAVKQQKIRHLRRLLSLQNYFSKKELRTWYERIGSPVVSVEHKIDGLTIALLYENNKLVSGATRGDGDIGEDVTANIPHIEGIPMVLPEIPGVDPNNNMLYVRCECSQPVIEFYDINNKREKNGLEPFANPRASASGGLRSNDPKECAARKLCAQAFQIISARGWDNILTGTQGGNITLLDSLGFCTVPTQKCVNFDEIWKEIQSVGYYRNILGYWVDGIAIKTDNLKLAERLGEGGKYPVHSAAYKYPTETKTTTVKKILLQTGCTGVVTPVAEIEPVQLSGTTISRVTLHNQKFIRNHTINEGCEIEIITSGEIIPKVVRVTKPSSEPYLIDICPACGGTLRECLDQDKKPTGIMVCSNTGSCPAQFLRYLEFFCSRDVMNISGMGPSTIKALAAAGLIQEVWDIYDLPYKLEEIATLPEFGKTKANALAKSINASKNNDIDRLIKALGIPGVGRHIGRMLAREYPDMEQIRRLGIDTLMAHDGIGEITARDFTAFWESIDGKRLYKNLKAKGVNVISKSWKLLD